MKYKIKFKINGEEVELDVKPNIILLDLIRDKLGITGPKRGCEQGECGACTVLMNGYPIKSCITLAVEADGSEIQTIEGLSKNGRLDPLQKNFIKYNAVQCGFCTPGMIMTAKALLSKKLSVTDAEIRKSIAGNLCRCTGYNSIVRAISETSKELVAKNAEQEGRVVEFAVAQRKSVKVLARGGKQ